MAEDIRKNPDGADRAARVFCCARAVAPPGPADHAVFSVSVLEKNIAWLTADRT